jgi:DNA-binding LacI/PurR family transcriptional regulator
VSSVREIAAKAKVSVATVSRALNNHPDVDPQTRAKVLAAANKSGYNPKIGRRITTVVGLVYVGESIHQYYGAFDSALLAGILRGLNEFKFDLKLINMQRDKSPRETYTQFFLRKGLRGVMLRTTDSTRSICEAIAAEGYPSVVIADRFDSPAVNSIECDSKADSRRAVEHLIDLGHRRIAIAIHHVRDTDHRDRLEGYVEALTAAGIPIDQSLIVDIIGHMDGGSHAIAQLMGMAQPPTAVYFTDPLATLGAMRRCLEMGIRVPQELSIIGFDDSDIRYHTYPRVTCVCQDAPMLGFEAAQWLTRMLNDMAPTTFKASRSTNFEINQTTGPAASEPVRFMPDGTRVRLGGGSGKSAETGEGAKSRGRNPRTR